PKARASDPKAKRPRKRVHEPLRCYNKSCARNQPMLFGSARAHCGEHLWCKWLLDPSSGCGDPKIPKARASDPKAKRPRKRVHEPLRCYNKSCARNQPMLFGSARAHCGEHLWFKLLLDPSSGCGDPKIPKARASDPKAKKPRKKGPRAPQML